MAENPRIEGLDTMAEISTFLAGLSFASILLFIGNRSSVPNLVFLIKDYPVNITDLTPLFLGVTFVLFMFAAFAYGTAIYQRADPNAQKGYSDKLENRATNLMTTGVISMFGSLFLVLSLVNLLIAFIVTVLSVLLMIYLMKG